MATSQDDFQAALLKSLWEITTQITQLSTCMNAMGKRVDTLSQAVGIV